MTILLKSAKIIDPNGSFHQQTKDLLIEDGVITSIENSIQNNGTYEEINLDDLHISKGWFDSGVCFGEPGFEERETIENGLKTAAKSGFTAVAIQPNTYPKADSNSAIEFLINKANGSAVAVHPIGNLTKKAESKDIAELYDMKNSGAIAFGDYNKAVSNGNLLKIGLQYAQNFDGLILSFPQDNSIAQNGLVNEEVNSTKLGLKGIPALAETLQISRDLFILEYTGGKLHIPTISTEQSVKLIAEAKQKGLDVTCSVTPHHLCLTDEELFSFDSNTKVLPPLRTSKDTEALLEGVKNGTIDMITSDHNPLDVEIKKVEYNNAAFGSIGLESLFGALNQVLDLDTLVLMLTDGPKNRFGIENPAIEVGSQANLSLFTPEATYIFSEEDILSSSKNSVFMNKPMKGKAYGIIVGKQLVL